MKNYPCIRTKLPGPNAAYYLEREKQFVSPSSTKSYPLVVKSAKGMVVTDVDENIFLDFTAGAAVCNTGHNHDQIISSITNQASTLIHMSGADFYNPLQIQLAEKLSAICPGDYTKRVFFGNSGAESVEAAFKLARYHTKRSIVIAFYNALYQLTRDFNILYVADEVQSGMGRTGRMFASGHFDIVPDIITLAKGIASGLPLSAMVASEKIMNWLPGSHASTFGGNPVSCQAALTTIRLLEEGLIDNAAKQGAYMINELKKLERAYPIIGDVRGLGLMLAAEIVKDKGAKEYAPEVRDSIIQKAFSKGLLLLGCGRSAIRFCPPLILTKNDADIALSIFEECLKETLQNKL